MDDGLPEPIRDIAQTADGYLWIATATGLVRFDGVRFVPVAMPEYPALSGSTLLSLYVTPGDDLWVGAKDGWTYRRRDGQWRAFPIDTETHWVSGFIEDGDGRLWALSSGPPLAQFVSDAWVRDPQPLARAWVPFTLGADGRLWTYLDPADPGHPDTERRPVVRGPEGFEPAPMRGATSFADARGGPLLHRPHPDDPTRTDVLDASGREVGWFRTGAERRIARLADRAGRLWVHETGDRGHRLLIVRDGVELARIEPEGATWFDEILEDRQGGVWTFTQGSGLIQITETPFERYTTADGLPAFAVHVALAPDGSVVSSTGRNRGVSTVATLREGTVSPERYVLDGAVTDVRNVTVAPDGVRWGADGSMLLRLVDGRAERVYDAASKRITVVHADADAVWIGRADGLVARVDPATGRVTDSTRVDGTEPGGEVRDLHLAPDGRVWIAGDRGLAVWDVGSGRLRPVDALAVPVRGLAVAPGGALWAATEGRGLAHVGADGAVRALGTAEGMPADRLTSVTDDGLGALWLTGQRRLYRVPLADAEAVLAGRQTRVHATALRPSDGHLGASDDLTATVRAPDGSLWIPSDLGVTRVFPGRFAARHAAPPTVLAETVTTEAGEIFALADGLRLPLGERTLTLAYTATDLLAPEHVRFRTWLEGRDTAWTDRGAERRTVVGGLAPGRYTLHVQARNAAGVWSAVRTAPAFTVPARVTETPWFFGLCALALAGLVWVGVRVRVRRLTARQRDLERAVAERTASLEARTHDLAAERETVAAQAAELRTLDEAKNRLFANVSHEFRTPLTLILGPLAALDARGDLSERDAAQVGVARRSAHRLLDLVDQLLALARADAGEITPRPVRLDAAAFGARVAASFRALADREGIVLVTELPATEAAFDPVMVETALSNLLANALSFTPASGTVTLALHPPADGRPLAFTVADTGPGLTPEHAARVFDRFYQADASTTRRGSGTGIGLALVREVARLHGGAATVESAPGDGCTFTLSLPRPDEPVPDAAPATPPGAVSTPRLAPRDTSGDGQAGRPPTLDRPCVLVVDDNADLRALVRGHLAERYDVLTAADGHEALALAQAHHPDAVVSDVMMPGLDGLGLVRALRADPETDFLAVLLLTARAAVEDTVEGLGAGADDYLAKPFEPAELRARVDALIAGRRRLRERLGEAPTAAPLPGVRPEATAEQRRLVRRVVDVVAARLDDETLTMDALAARVHLSRATLYRRLDGALDGTPADLVRDVRLGHAMALLADGAGSVAEVAYAVGFRSVSHFAARFKAYAGTTPSAFAQRGAPHRTEAT